MSWSDGACCVVWELHLSSEIAVEKRNLEALSLLYYKQVIDKESNCKHLLKSTCHIYGSDKYEI
jgi:hypothetical protein